MWDKENWSPKKFSKFYAALTAMLIILISFLLLHFQAIEIINLRFAYIPIIFFGIFAYMRDFALHTEKRIRYIKAFVHCFRTGVYTCLILLPVILTLLYIGLPRLGIAERTGRFDEGPYQVGFLISLFVEIFTSTLISSFVASFIPGIVQKKNL